MDEVYPELSGVYCDEVKYYKVRGTFALDVLQKRIALADGKDDATI